MFHTALIIQICASYYPLLKCLFARINERLTTRLVHGSLTGEFGIVVRSTILMSTLQTLQLKRCNGLSIQGSLTKASPLPEAMRGYTR